jgi:hypothetical protein
MRTLQSAQATAAFSDAVVSSPIRIQSTGYAAQLNRSGSPLEKSLTPQAMAALLVLPIAITCSVISSSIVVEDPTQRLRDSGAVSVWGRTRRRGKRLSLGDARLRALMILAETEARIQQERKEEFASYFADEDFIT